MRKWLGVGTVVAVLLLLAITARWWLASLLDFLGAQGDRIQSLADAIQIMLWIVAAAGVIVGWWRRPKSGAGEQPQPRRTTAKARDEAVIAQGDSVAARQIAVGGDVAGDIILVADPDDLWRLIRKRPPAADLRAATEAYLKYLVDRYRYLDFRGMGVSDRVPLRLPLAEMYVPLAARIELPEGETWARQLLLAGRKLTAEEAEVMGKRVSEPLPLLKLLQEHDGLIILGDPGAGKTTFLKYLTLMLAEGKGQALGLKPGLPILVPLSAYANALDNGNEIPLHRFIADYYNSRGVDLPLGAMLDEALQQGGALLLLDGLDEVRNQGQRRLVVERVIDFFATQRRKGNKFIVTSRIVGYREVRPNVEGLVECTIVDFDQEAIELFVGKWTEAIERAAHGATPTAVQEAAREQQELLAAVARNPGVRQLAANPLLLTILALMKRQGVTLPERRVELYQKYVETLLKHWNLARGLGRPPTRDLDVVETMKVLAPLALWMHETSPGVGLVKQEAMRRKLVSIYSERNMPEPEQKAAQFLTDVRDYAGLLLERGPREYGFIHLTFQEYLAAMAIGMQGQRSIEPIIALLVEHVGEETWREVSLLTVGYLGIIQQRDEAAGEVVNALIAQAPGRLGEAAVLAGEAVLDAWPGGVTYACRDKTVQALLQTMGDDAHVSPVQRAAAGVVLGKLGDPREGVGVSDGLPDILWSEVIPAGPFPMGNDKPEARYKDEQPRFQCTLIRQPYRISRYAITVAQYRCFIRAEGYQTAKWWSKAGWAWRKENAITGPRTYGEPFELDNHPQVGVSWYEAHAFCQWLAEATGLPIRLPSEAEWERAARHTDARLYPWGQEAPNLRCNMSDTGIGSTCAVGLFPDGDAVCGAANMSGNVWEWCRTKWRGNYERYEQQADDDPAGSERRVVRGGSWFGDESSVRCAFRRWYDPDDRFSNSGFRVVCSPSTFDL